MPPSAQVVGINHVALEVADVGTARAFCGRLFVFEQAGRAELRAKGLA